MFSEPVPEETATGATAEIYERDRESLEKVPERSSPWPVRCFVATVIETLGVVAEEELTEALGAVLLDVMPVGNS